VIVFFTLLFCEKKHFLKSPFGISATVIHETNLNLLEIFSKVFEWLVKSMAQILITKARI
jgi:hypothetical protein